MLATARTWSCRATRQRRALTGRHAKATAAGTAGSAGGGARGARRARQRVRQHVNPLSAALLARATPPDWSSVFRDPSLPLHLDVGCAHGKFAAALAQRHRGSANVLGLEIREACVSLAEREGLLAAADNLHLMFCNATTSLAPLLRHYPGWSKTPVETDPLCKLSTILG